MIITIALMIFGGLPLFWVITLITVIGLFELYRAVKMEKTVPALIGYAASIGLDLLLAAQKTDYVIMLLIGALMLMMACYVIAYPKYCSEQIIMVFFGLIYVTMMLSYVFQVRMLEGGQLIVWLIFIGAWGSDTCAYCVGKLIGKHKMPSKLSPNKTIEGCVGGIIGAACRPCCSAFPVRKQAGIRNNNHIRHPASVPDCLLLQFSQQLLRPECCSTESIELPFSS